MLETHQKLLLITAHPDDECMFFLPALTYFQRHQYTIHILCLSNGGVSLELFFMDSNILREAVEDDRTPLIVIIVF